MTSNLAVSVSLNVSGQLPIATSAASAQRTADGRVQFENDNYRITAGDNDEVIIFNKGTGESYRIWGDPHVEIDGKHAFDFWGQTTFQLDDGTKVTIETTPWDKGGNGATVASVVTITDGDYGVQISGVDSNTAGDLSFQEFAGGGRVLDAAVRDGNVLLENETGRGFLAVDRDGNIRHVDQAFILATDELKNGGPDFLAHFAEILAFFTGLMSISFNGGLALGTDNPHRVRESAAMPVPWQFSMTLSISA
ncbi:DUF1521 domain-containing protein [Luteimonas deserti]|uniref:DUF1521 domain-containing protein n=1 Tax=Luteimonas deserti TaxID=2752306 RepID=A0A7Z0TY38_9GAMM|nr:DUF1521 domain-containing protein [Luteimonas deserti]NYZ62510.1 DUF1521 domain-containing protein [Luteimonas deserti]